MTTVNGEDRRLRGRLAVLGLALFVYLTAEMFPVGALPEIAAGLDVEESTAGLLLSGYAVAAGVTAIPVVVWLSRRDRRTVLTTAMVLLAASQTAPALAPPSRSPSRLVQWRLSPTATCGRWCRWWRPPWLRRARRVGRPRRCSSGPQSVW